MSGERSKLPDIVSKWAVQSGAKGILRGGALCGVSTMVLAISPAIPEDWELYVQWPAYGTLIIGLLVSIHSAVFRND